MNYKAIIQYNGTNFAGYAKQNNERTVEGELEKALKALFKKKPAISVAGRTDAGVHALEQVINFKGNYKPGPDDLHYRLNSILPADICVKSVAIVDNSFDARRSAKARQYVYRILNRSYTSPFHDDFCYHFAKKLNVEAMQRASVILKGKHNFKAFAAVGTDRKTYIRDLKKLIVENKSDFFDIHSRDMVKITVMANSFLHHMVRNIVGTLIEVGRGKLSVEEVEYILKSQDRRKAGPTAPAKCLFLEKVYY